MTADGINDGIALLASLVGLSAVVVAWIGSRRVPPGARLRHPSTPAPVSFSVVRDATDAHWRVGAPATLPATLAIDIVTYRTAGTDEPWISEPIIDPVVLEPGESAVLPSVIEDPDAIHDVVVAWTVRLPDGHVQGSRTLTVPAPVDPDAVITPSLGLSARDSRGFVPVYAAVAALLVIAMLVSLWELVDSRSSSEGDLTIIGTSVPTTAATAATAAPLIDTTTVAPATEPPETAPSTTSPETTSPATTSAVAASTSSTSVPQGRTTTSTTTTAPTTTTTLPPADGRRVVIRGRVEDCRFGSNCVIAGFDLVGEFAVSGEYVCEFDDGSRFVFRYVGDRADDACATAGPNPSITIEVDGVRSLTVTRQSPTGG